jgi:hypothetical protein
MQLNRMRPKEDKLAFNVQPDNRPDGIPDCDRFYQFYPFFCPLGELMILVLVVAISVI